MKQWILRTASLLLLLTRLGAIDSQAQVLTALNMRTQMVRDWERAKAYTLDYLHTMPAGKYDFKPVDSIRSFAQQMLHLASGNIYLMTSATDRKPPDFSLANTEERPSALQKDSVVYYVTASYDYCIDAVKSYDVNKWGERKKLQGQNEYRWTLLMKAFEHQTHHRGQTTIYIRLQGIAPPAERLW